MAQLPREYNTKMRGLHGCSIKTMKGADGWRARLYHLDSVCGMATGISEEDAMCKLIYALIRQEAVHAKRIEALNNLRDSIESDQSDG